MIHKDNQLKTQRIEGIGIGSLYFGAAFSGWGMQLEFM